MGLCACNSAGHLTNHTDIAPNHAGITFAISNTIVSSIFSILYTRFCKLRSSVFKLNRKKNFNSIFLTHLIYS